MKGLRDFEIFKKLVFTSGDMGISNSDDVDNEALQTGFLSFCKGATNTRPEECIATAWDSALSDMVTARSFNQFEVSFDILEICNYHSTSINSLNLSTVFPALKRGKDEELLARILEFLSGLPSSSNAFEGLIESAEAIVSNMLLKVLKESLIIENGVRTFNSVKRRNLNCKILIFIRSLLDTVGPPFYDITAKTGCATVVIDYIESITQSQDFDAHAYCEVSEGLEFLLNFVYKVDHRYPERRLFEIKKITEMCVKLMHDLHGYMTNLEKNISFAYNRRGLYRLAALILRRLRKECLLLIKNFILAFCLDRHDGLSDLKKVSSGVSHESLESVLRTFESCGFFEHLDRIISGHEGNAVYRLALSELLLVLSYYYPKAMFEQMRLNCGWVLLEEHLKSAMSPTILLDDSAGKKPLYLPTLAWKQTNILLSDVSIRMVENIFEILRLCSFDQHDTVVFFVNHTTFLSTVFQLLHNFLVKHSTYPKPRLEFQGLQILAEWLWVYSQKRGADLQAHFEDGQPGLSILAWACNRICEKIDYGNGMATIYLSRILSLHCSELVNLNLDKALSLESLGLRLTRALAETFLEDKFSNTEAIMESLLISLEILTSRFHFAKLCVF
ncbi:hypothetical protein BC829DRAFT_420614 [Chytridium lagenaria]|nr:hypothetical protein BC829DRAFT_420614 [Chytridium lagenaria]